MPLAIIHRAVARIVYFVSRNYIVAYFLVIFKPGKENC